MWRKIIDDYRLYCLNDLFEIKWIFYSLSRMLQLSEFVWALSYSVLDGYNKFLLIDATDRSKISSDQKRFFIALSLYPLSFFANTPFKERVTYLQFTKMVRLTILLLLIIYLRVQQAYMNPVYWLYLRISSIVLFLC